MMMIIVMKIVRKLKMRRLKKYRDKNCDEGDD